MSMTSSARPITSPYPKRPLPDYGTFDPVPDVTKPFRARGELTAADCLVLGHCLRQYRPELGYAPLRGPTREADCTRRGVMEAVGIKSEREVQRSFARLKKHRLMEHVPDRNVLGGYRIGFPFTTPRPQVPRPAADENPAPQGGAPVSGGERPPS